ncbi:hypothetical protein GCM10011579_017250 [Streptomyces albiflavescens]|uniref:Uncharacterized protein n=1 Tax=Streptomyces albiflavescens TaxID=1623582 RepID=A0A917XXZ9_9ACTN|nr:hypothetical protein [Streptomyces albiflavescens]GGN56334.1 hypothetical protein GCM10011579_017250 [Streptomyces albiflavescens]
MQWTDQSGGAYGEDPYSDVGYAYAHGYGYGYGGSATADTATLSWHPEEPAQWTYPQSNAQATGADPYAAEMPLYAAGPGPATTAWGVPHGGVLTMPPPPFDAPGHPVPGPDTPVSESVRPVFVDSSGRRQRRVLRAARLLVIPAGGYVALLISTMLGGPSISSPFVPQQDSAHPATPRATAPDSSSGTGHSGESASSTAAREISSPAARKTPSAPAATSGPTAAPTRITAPTSTVTRTSKGRAVGSSHKPVK